MAQPDPTRRIDRDQSLLLVVDVQQRLVPHIRDHERLLARIGVLLAAAARLGIPRLATEHCARELGALAAPLRACFAPDEIFTKTRFGAADQAGFVEWLRVGKRPQVVVAGMEAHVCVLQTAMGLVAAGFPVFLAADAIGSRSGRDADREYALERLRTAGCTLAGTETVLFEWARGGDDDAFRDVLKLVKSLPG